MFIRNDGIKEGRRKQQNGGRIEESLDTLGILRFGSISLPYVGKLFLFSWRIK